MKSRVDLYSLIVFSHSSFTWRGCEDSKREPLKDDLVSNGPIFEESREEFRPLFSGAVNHRYSSRDRMRPTSFLEQIRTKLKRLLTLPPIDFPHCIHLFGIRAAWCFAQISNVLAQVLQFGIVRRANEGVWRRNGP